MIILYLLSHSVSTEIWAYMWLIRPNFKTDLFLLYLFYFFRLLKAWWEKSTTLSKYYFKLNLSKTTNYM